MSTNIYLTDQDSGIPGYRLATVGRRSDACSLVRAVTATEAGPSSGVQVTRTSGGTALVWITEPLLGVTLTAAAWVAHLWAKESAAAANASLRVQIYQWTVAEAGTALLDSNPGTELGITTADIARTTSNATLTNLASGDRLVIKLLIDDAGTMAAGQTVTLAYNGQFARREGDSYLVCPDPLTVLGGVPLTTITAVRRLVAQAAAEEGEAPPELTQNEVLQAVSEALRTYTADRPLVLVAAMSGDGSAYDFPLPGQWVWGQSNVLDIEYPAGDQVPSYVDDTDWTVRESVLGGQPTRLLRFLATAPASGTDNILVRYTSRHVHTTETDTVPADDLDAVCCLAGSIVAEMLGAAKANSSDSTINADTVNHRDGEQRWGAVARRLRARYTGHLGIGGPVAAASGWTDWDASLSDRTDRLFHGRRLR